MSYVFGAVAEQYDDVRPGYPPQIAADLIAYHGGVPAEIVELGAGTGKGTEVLAATGAALTCVEPDVRMAAVLRAKFPAAQVVAATFEEWSPPSGGVPMIACAMAWHWLDEETRNQRAHAALTPGGTLAVFGHRYGYADAEHERRIGAAFRAVDPVVTEKPVGWAHEDICRSAQFTDVRSLDVRRHHAMTAEQYLRLVQTFSPFRRRSDAVQSELLDVLGSVLDDLGGRVVLDLHTTLVLARRPHTATMSM